MISNNKLKPLFPWVGGKYRIANQIIDLMQIPDDTQYLISPTCGGLGFDTKFHLKYPKIKIICSDTNNWLIDLYNSIKYHPDIFIKKILKYEKDWQSLKSKEIKKSWYYELRNNFNYSKLDKLDKSVLFFVLLKTGFNGLMQINKDGQLTTAFGFGVISKLVDISNYKKFVKFTKNCKFIHRDFQKSLNDIDDNSIVYIDPLYKDSNLMYSKESSMSLENTLIDYMKTCKNYGSKVTAMSNSYDPLFWKQKLPNSEIYTITRNQGIHRDVVKKGRYTVKENLIILR